MDLTQARRVVALTASRIQEIWDAPRTGAALDTTGFLLTGPWTLSMTKDTLRAGRHFACRFRVELGRISCVSRMP